MGGRGFAPKSNHLKILESVREDRINRDEPIPSELPAVPAVELTADAQAVWDRLAPDMIAKCVLTSWDVDLFAAFCRTVAIYNRAATEVEKSGLSVEGSVGNRVVNSSV